MRFASWWLPALLLLSTGCHHKQLPTSDPRSGLSADDAQKARLACTFGAGTMPGMSAAKDAPLGDDIPIDTVVVLMLENRSFDHLLQALPAYGQPDVEVAPSYTTNPDSDGSPRPIFHLTDYCFDDTSHGWTDVHDEWANGGMSGFVLANNHNDAKPADGKRAMGYYTDDDLPFIYGLASTFALADRNFSSVLGPTFPNREYLYAGTSFGHTGNDILSDYKQAIFTELEAGHIDWRLYYEDTPAANILLGTMLQLPGHAYQNSQLFDDARRGKLGQVNFVDPRFLEGDLYNRDDFHPPGNVQYGQKFVADVINTLMLSPQWGHMAIIVTFDEHGGVFDHVAPPPACPPDDTPPQAKDYLDVGFSRYGIRVPLVVVSPYSRPHYVSHLIYDHTSVTRFIETRYHLPALSRRDANADPLLDLFDFKQAAFASPPSLPAAVIDDLHNAACRAKYPAP